jgi:hypothetical protein
MDFYHRCTAGGFFAGLEPWVKIVSWLWNHHGHLNRHRHRGEKFFAPTTMSINIFKFSSCA